MNKQLIDLMNEANKDAGFTFTMDQAKPVHDLMEKFAELIIKDCASLCEIESRSYTYSFTPAKAKLAESTAKHCGYIIKRHFGIKDETQP